jgi:hypothetical protein
VFESAIRYVRCVPITSGYSQEPGDDVPRTRNEVRVSVTLVLPVPVVVVAAMAMIIAVTNHLGVPKEVSDLLLVALISSIRPSEGRPPDTGQNSAS